MPMKPLMGTLLSLFGLGTAWTATPIPDFKLVDVNTNSVRSGQKVSPRDYLLQVSGYYFGQAH